MRTEAAHIHSFYVFFMCCCVFWPCSQFECAYVPLFLLPPLFLSLFFLLYLLSLHSHRYRFLHVGLMVAASNHPEISMKILVDQATREVTSSHFVYQTLPPISLKGKSQLIPIFSPLDPEDVCLPPSSGVHPHIIVGREKELQVLTNTLDALVGSQKKAVVLLHGV